MKMTREVQIAVFVCLYLQRSGKANFTDIYTELKVGTSAIERVLSRLEEGGIIIGDLMVGDLMVGELELAGDPSINDIITLFDTNEAPIRGLSVEHRGLAAYTRSVKQALKPVLDRKISNINKELVANEVAVRERANEDGVEN